MFDVCGANYDFNDKERPLTQTIYKNGELTAGFTVEQQYSGKYYTVS